MTMDLAEYLTDLFYKLVLVYFCWVTLVMFLALIGKSFYVRHLFVRILILIFEWGKLRIQDHEQEVASQRMEEDDPTADSSDPTGEPGMQTAEPDVQTSDAHPAQTEPLSDNPDGTETGEDKDSHEYDKIMPNGDAAGLIIEREVQITSSQVRIRKMRSLEEMKHEYELSDAMYFAKCGIEAIIEDGVTQRFSAEELPSWNLLTRTNMKHEFISYRLTILWLLGWILRYIILFPFRFSLSLVAINSMIGGTALIGYFVPSESLRRRMYFHLSKTCYRIMARAFSAVIYYHNQENRAKGGGICVANHTSPIDIIVLGCDNTYAMVGQAQGGFFGIMQSAFSRAETHVWFNRSEATDRSAVSRRLREHIEDKNKLPILIFPEGTCINNTSIMMFKKGSFETGGVIYPVAIKYDSRFADPFWNSSCTNLLHHLLLIMTSWALVVDVWYLPPEVIREDETSVDFANRVKAEIASKGGLVDLEWDGQLKRMNVKPRMKEKQQENYSKTIKCD